MAVRGSPAKGVGWGNWREGSNPSFSAKPANYLGWRVFYCLLFGGAKVGVNCKKLRPTVPTTVPSAFTKKLQPINRISRSLQKFTLLLLRQISCFQTDSYN